jgi:hypothetical protein
MAPGTTPQSCHLCPRPAIGGTQPWQESARCCAHSAKGECCCPVLGAGCLRLPSHSATPAGTHLRNEMPHLPVCKGHPMTKERAIFNSQAQAMHAQPDMTTGLSCSSLKPMCPGRLQQYNRCQAAGGSHPHPHSQQKVATQKHVKSGATRQPKQSSDTTTPCWEGRLLQHHRQQSAASQAQNSHVLCLTDVRAQIAVTGWLSHHRALPNDWRV